MLKKSWEVTSVSLILLCSIPPLTYGAERDAATNTLCSIALWGTNGVMSGFEVLSIIIVGIMALQNKVPLNFLILHAVGIALLRGSASVVSALGGMSAGGCI